MPGEWDCKASLALCLGCHMHPARHPAAPQGPVRGLPEGRYVCPAWTCPVWPACLPAGSAAPERLCVPVLPVGRVVAWPALCGVLLPPHRACQGCLCARSAAGRWEALQQRQAQRQASLCTQAPELSCLSAYRPPVTRPTLSARRLARCSTLARAAAWASRAGRNSSGTATRTRTW